MGFRFRLNASTSPASSVAEALRAKIADRSARVGIVGLGYVGLPLAVELARAGFRATGVDLDRKKVDAINRGESYTQDVPTSDVAEFYHTGKLTASADASVLASIDTINICVPTPLR